MGCAYGRIQRTTFIPPLFHFIATMKLSKRKLSELKTLSVVHEVLQYYGHAWVKNPPDEWDNYEKQIYDMANEIETRMLKAFLKTLGVE